MNEKSDDEINPFLELSKESIKMINDSYERIIFDEYITMRDGVKIAVTVSLPKLGEQQIKMPTFLSQTRYWRAMNLRLPFRWLINEMPLATVVNEIYNSYGYATVSVDVRGTGASFGTRNFPFTREEVQDGNELLNWIISQPWSNGMVCSSGGSYLGTAAEYLTTHNNPALKSIVLGHCSWDAFLDGAAPGGCFNYTFMQMWSLSGKLQDQNNPKMFKQNLPLFWLLIDGVKPVNSKSDPNLLQEAIKEHLNNQYVYELTKDLNFRDDKLPDGNPVDYISTFYHKQEIEESKVPILSWSSWLDSGYGDVVIHRFLNLDNPQIGILGDWNHGATIPSNQFFPNRKEVNPALEELLKTWLHFFHQCINNKQPNKKVLYYYTMVEEKWKKTEIWPPEGHTYSRWFFTDNNTLEQVPPQTPNGSDTYKVDFFASTGKNNRWWTLMGFKVLYGDRAVKDKKLLTYTSEPFKQDVEITGNPIISINLSTTHQDGVIYAYLEDINPEGIVTYITDGHMRFIHRKISHEPPLYKTMVPYHSYKRKDALPVIPHKIMEIKMGLFGTSVVIKKGHRIRIALAGHDRETFTKYPSSGKPVITVYRNSTNSSYIDIPIIKKKSHK
jgi:uncharacterized protein